MALQIFQPIRMFKIEHKITQKKIFLGLGPGSDPIKKQRYAHFEAEIFDQPIKVLKTY